jgi:hypothetical protein
MTRGSVRLSRGRGRRERLIVLSALLFPALFLAVVAVGIVSMKYGRLSLFRPLLMQAAEPPAPAPQAKRQ